MDSMARLFCLRDREHELENPLNILGTLSLVYTYVKIRRRQVLTPTTEHFELPRVPDVL